MTRHLVEDVLALAVAGMHVFPLLPDDKRPALHGEKACKGAGDCTNGHQGWEQRAITDPDRIRNAWSRAPFGVGVACGPSGLVVVDLDTAKGDEPPAPGIQSGEDVLALLYEHHGDRYPIGTAPTVRTPSGGTHIYFRTPHRGQVRNSASRIGWKVDVRAHGGYVVAPPSTHQGSPYAWLTAPHEVEPLPLPAWLARAVIRQPEPVRRPVMPAAVRNGTGYVAAALQGEIQRVLDARPGTRNDTLVRAAFSLGQLIAAERLDARQTTDALTAAGQSIGLHPHEVQATVTSGITAGMQHPRSSQCPPL